MKFGTLSYKKRNLYLIIGSFLFLIVAYATTIKKTVALYIQNTSMMASLTHDGGTSAELEQLHTRFNTLDNYMKMYSLDSIKNQQYIMSEVSDLCRLYHLTLTSFPKASVMAENDVAVETNVIETEGTFVNNIQLMYGLETKRKIGRVSSVSFLSRVDNKTKRTRLTMTLYLQNVRKKDGAVKI
jgi:hypothetical protein